jgi:5-methylcytosine-specific restriction endonuclease McrA
MASGDKFYSSMPWLRLRSKVKAQWRRAGKPCAYCGQALDWATKRAVVVDHIINRRQRPDLAMDINNTQCVCHPCNTRKAHHVELNNKIQVNDDGLPPGW